MLRRTATLLLVLLATVATAGCGGDEPQATPRPPELTVPNEGEPAEDTTDTGTTQQTPPAAPQQPPDASGGSPAPSPRPQQPDTPQSDTPPPQNSPAERFERFCDQNPGACG
jgi:hypothetical protein